MKPVRGLVCLAALISAPTFAQEAPGGGIDWSKPVPGVDGFDRTPRSKPIPGLDSFDRTPGAPRMIEDAPRPVEVYTRAELEAAGAPSIKEFLESLSARGAAPACVPDGKPAAGGKETAVCPVPPSGKQ